MQFLFTARHRFHPGLGIADAKVYQRDRQKRLVEELWVTSFVLVIYKTNAIVFLPLFSFITSFSYVLKSFKSTLCRSPSRATLVPFPLHGFPRPRLSRVSNYKYTQR